MKSNRFNIIRYSVLFVIVLCIFGIYHLKQSTKIAIQQAEIDMYPQVINLEELKSYKKPTFINFGLSMCMACRDTRKALEAVDVEKPNSFIYQIAEIDKHPDIASDFSFTAVPTQVIYNADGTPYKPSEDADIKIKHYYSEDNGEILYSYHEGPLTVEEVRIIVKDMGVE